MPRNYNSPTLVYVTIEGYTALKYAFRSKLRDSLRDNFGQIVIEANIASIAGIAIGVNAPKPPRASKFINAAEGIASSFCDKDKIASLKDDGYSITRGRSSTATKGASSETWYISINGINYAWRAALPPELPSSFTQTGISVADGSERDLVFGAQFPKPARMKHPIQQGIFSTFVQTSRIDELAAAGWTPAKGAINSVNDLLGYI